MTTTGARGATTSPASASLSVTMPPTGALSVVSFSCFSSVAMAAAAVAMRAWATPISSGLAPAFTRAKSGHGRLDPSLAGVEARPGHVEPGGGVVAILLGAALAFEEQLEALEVGGGRLDFGAAGRDLGLRGTHLRLGLPHVLGPGGHAHQPQLRFGRRLLGPGAVDRQRDVGGIDGEDARAGLDAVAFLHVEAHDAPAHFRGETHVGGFDVAGGAEAIGILGLLTGGGERRQRRGDGQGGATGSDRGHRERSFFGASPPAASIRSAVCCMWATSAWRSTWTKSGNSWRPGCAAARSRTAFISSGPMIDM